MGGKGGFEPKVIGYVINNNMLQCMETVKLSVKDIVVPLWQGAKGKFGGNSPLCPPQIRLCN